MVAHRVSEYFQFEANTLLDRVVEIDSEGDWGLLLGILWTAVPSTSDTLDFCFSGLKDCQGNWPRKLKA